MSYLWIAIGSAIGGVLRYGLTRMTLSVSAGFPFGTMLVNVLGSFILGYFGTLTLHTGKHPASEDLRLFVMVGLCGGFTTFSSFSLQTFDLLRAGAWGRALLNVVLSVVLSVAAVAGGHFLAQGSSGDNAIAQSSEEELSG